MMVRGFWRCAGVLWVSMLLFLLLLPAFPVWAEDGAQTEHGGPNGCGICCAMRGGACRDLYTIPPYAITHKCPSPAHPCPGGRPAEPTKSPDPQPARDLRPVGVAVAPEPEPVPTGHTEPTPYPPSWSPAYTIVRPEVQDAVAGPSATDPTAWRPSYIPNAAVDPMSPPNGTGVGLSGVPVVDPRNAVVTGRVAPQSVATADQAFFVREPGDAALYTGPFILERVPILAEHKFPQFFGCSMRVIPKLRLYPFLAFNVYRPVESGRELLATNFVFNSVHVPPGGIIEAASGGGLGYIEQFVDDGVEKFMALRLRDHTIKITRLDAEGRGVYAVYTINGRPWAMFAQRYIETDSPVQPTILYDEWSHPRESIHLRRLLSGYDDHEFMGYWSIPQGEQVAGWDGIELQAEMAQLQGPEAALVGFSTPLDIGAFDIGFEEALTYTEPAYDTPRRRMIPLPYRDAATPEPGEPGSLVRSGPY